MRRVVMAAACLAMIGAAACASPTAPARSVPEETRRNGGMVGSGYDDGGFGSGHDSAPGDTANRGGMVGSGF